MANLSAIKLPNGTTYNLKDNGALQLTGGSVTGPVSFGDSVSIDEATVGDLIVNGSASFTNNLQANTINGVTVGSNPKFTDTNTVTTATTTGSGNAVTAVTASNGALTITKGTTFLTASSTLDASKLSGAIPSAVTATTQASTDNSTKIATTAYVTTAIANLPEPMVFKGSVGTGGTVTSLPTAAASNEGWTYKVITALSSPAAKVGDTVISNGSSWVVIPSGDEPSGTVTSVAASGGGGISISGSPITTSGTITIGLNLSTAINGLGEGTSQAHRDDYAVVQYAGGGTTTTTYHRRKLSNIFAALNKSDITTALGYTPPTSDTNTWRTIQVNGTDVLGSGTGTGKLNLKAGTNVSLSNSSGTVTIAATDTNTWRGIQDNLTSTSTTESLSANQGRLLKNTKAEYRSIGSCADYQRVVIGLCELSANASSGTSSHTSGSLVSIRSNGLVPEYVSQFVFQDDYSTAKACNYSFIGNFENTNTTLRAGEGFRACTFTYNSKYYAGLEFYQTQARSFYWYGEGNFEPFLVAYYNFHTSTALNTEINNSISLSTSVLKRRNITTDVSKVADSVTWSGVTGKPTVTGSKVTGITASTTATKTTLGTAFTIPNVTSAGSASTWAFEEVSIPNVTAAGSASTWTFGATVVGDGTLIGTIDSSDSSMLVITAGLKSVQQKTGGGNGSAPTLGTAIKVQSKKSGANGTAPTLGTAFTVPNVTGNTSATVSITDPGHTHSI